jgi:UDP-2,3-diacylglucosamine hydrolase
VSVLLVSDVHLSPARPERVDAFLDFLRGPAARAEALYILGDLFDLWLGDDDDRPPHRAVEAGLAALAARGVPVGIVPGNHDFLMGEALAARAGCRLLEEPSVVEIGGERVLLMHGDTLCTRDTDYQAYRKVARDRGVQREFLALPLAVRVERASALLLRSKMLTRLKPDDIMDVTEEAVHEILRVHRVRRLVHGHTHRPAIHAFDLDGEPASRCVLGDWYEQDSVLAWDAVGPRLVCVADL